MGPVHTEFLGIRYVMRNRIYWEQISDQISDGQIITAEPTLINKFKVHVI